MQEKHHTYKIIVVNIIIIIIIIATKKEVVEFRKNLEEIPGMCVLRAKVKRQ